MAAAAGLTLALTLTLTLTLTATLTLTLTLTLSLTLTLKARGHEHEIASMVGTCCPSLIAAIDRPWKVAGIGLLFGLGLDTATEIGLLTLSALGQPETPRACVLVLPLLFASGMALVDSLNAVLMAWAYEWAADNGPMHRLYFSLFLTCASAALALLVSI